MQNRYQRSLSEPSLHVKSEDTKNLLIFYIYIGDLIYTDTNQKVVGEFKIVMMKEFEMTNLGLMKYFLSIHVYQSKGEISR